MKKIVMFILFAIVLTVTMCYYDDPGYYNKMAKKVSKKNKNKLDFICELFD